MRHITDIWNGILIFWKPSNSFKKIILEWEEEKGGERVREKHLSVAFHKHPDWGSSLQCGHTPSLDQRHLNQQHFSAREDAQPTEPYQPGLNPETFKMDLWAIWNSCLWGQLVFNSLICHKNFSNFGMMLQLTDPHLPGLGFL